MQSLMTFYYFISYVVSNLVSGMRYKNTKDNLKNLTDTFDFLNSPPSYPFIFYHCNCLQPKNFQKHFSNNSNLIATFYYVF